MEEAPVDLVDPRLPRFGQLITASLLVAALLIQQPLLVYVTAAVLLVPVLTRWRLDLYGLTWRYLAVPLFGGPDRREPAAPHRFAKLLGATATTGASVLLVAASMFALQMLALAGFLLAAVIALLAAIAAIANVCVGCRLYKQVGFFHRRGIV